MSENSTDAEKWKVILNAPYYEISTLGKIRRIPRKNIVHDPTKKRSTAVTALRTGDTTITHFLVGELVLDTYVPKPSRHHTYPAFKDGNARNPVLSNVYWSNVKVV